MKSLLRVFAIVAIVILSTVSAVAQQPEESVTIPKSQLTDQQKADLATKQLSDKQAMFGKWVGIGDEVGKAVNSGLSAVTTQANAFAQTPVGKWTMFVIVFKVIGEKFVGYLVGACMFIFGVPIWIWSYRKYIPHKYLSKINYGPDGKKLSVEYGFGLGEGKNTLSSDDAGGWVIGHWCVLAVLAIAAFVVMFSGS